MTEFNTTRAPSVSDLRELFAARPAVLSALNEAFKLSGGFYVRAARWHSADEAAEVVLQAVGAVDCGAYDDETGEYHNEPLSVEVFTAANGNRIIDAVLTCGGPTVTARYESRYGSITVVANWGSALIELYGFEGDCPLRAYLSNFADFAE